MKEIPESEIDRIIPVIQNNCIASGGCSVYRNESSLSVVFGDEELCWITQEEGKDVELIRRKLKNALNV